MMDGLRERMREAAGLSHADRPLHAHFRDYASAGRPPPPSAARAQRFLYGLAQPVYAMRVLVGDRELLRAGLLPALLLTVVCAGAALLSSPGPQTLAFWRRFYTAFVALAPVPSILFARHYARLAARAHRVLGFGECQPRREPLGTSIRRAWNQFLVVTVVPAILAIPVSVCFGLLAALVLAGFGGSAHVFRPLLSVLAAIWALHWILVEALDNARVIEAGAPEVDDEIAAQRFRPPWFVRLARAVESRLPGWRKAPDRGVGGLLDRRSRAWREEIALVEDHLPLAIGLGLATAGLLAIPGLNLLFRPTIIIGSVHVIGHLKRPPAEAAAPPDFS